MGSAVVGLVGVIVGALLSGTVAYFMARRGEKQQARAAARILESELRMIGANLRMLLGALSHSNDARLDLRVLLRLPPQQGWETHKALLAATLEASRWYAVATAYESIAILRAASSTDALFVDEGRRPFHRLVDEFLVDLATNVQKGADALARLAGNTQPRTDPKSMTVRDAMIATLTHADTPTNDGDETP